MNKIEKVYYSDEILELLDDCYFHPERDKAYSTAEIKYAAQCAFLRLWNSRGGGVPLRTANNQLSDRDKPPKGAGTAG